MWWGIAGLTNSYLLAAVLLAVILATSGGQASHPITIYVISPPHMEFQATQLGWLSGVAGVVEDVPPLPTPAPRLSVPVTVPGPTRAKRVVRAAPPPLPRCGPLMVLVKIVFPRRIRCERSG